MFRSDGISPVFRSDRWLWVIAFVDDKLAFFDASFVFSDEEDEEEAAADVVRLVCEGRLGETFEEE